MQLHPKPWHKFPQNTPAEPENCLIQSWSSEKDTACTATPPHGPSKSVRHLYCPQASVISQRPVITLSAIFSGVWEECATPHFLTGRGVLGLLVAEQYSCVDFCIPGWRHTAQAGRAPTAPDPPEASGRAEVEP